MKIFEKWSTLIVISVFGFLFSIPAINWDNNKNETTSATSLERHLSDNSSYNKSNNKADSIVAFAKSLLGKTYKYASCGPDQFDCSGFVYYVYSKFKIDLSRSSYTMAEQGNPLELTEAKKGDLIFFKGTNINDPKVGHVGIIISEIGVPVEFIHASSGKQNAVIISKLSESNYTNRFIKVKRVF